MATVHRWALTATVGLGAAGVLSGSSRLAAGGAGLLAVTLVAGGTLLRPKSRLLAWTVNAATAVALVVLLAMLRQLQIDSVILIVMLGIFNRVLLRSGVRDDVIVVAAASVLLTIATTITPGLAFVPLVLTFVPAALWTLTASNVLGQGEKAGSVDRVAGLAAPRFRFGLAGPMLVLMILGYGAASIFPRYNFGRALSIGAFLPLPGADRKMEFRTGGLDLGSDGTVVVRVVPQDGLPFEEPLYARLYVLDRFERTTWSSSEDYRMELLESAAIPTEAGRPAQVRVRRMVDKREPHPVVLIGTRTPSAVSLRRPERDRDGTWYTRTPQASLDLEYRIDLEQPARVPPPAQAERFLEVPADLDPRIYQLGQTLADGRTGPGAKVEAVLRHFEEGGYIYSLDPMPGSSTDPLVRFFFEAKQGHCELYAGATAALLRLVGVPARVVTGFYGGWWNARAGTLELTRDDAHAWVEAWIDGRWVWVDATPPDLRTRRDGKPLAWLFDYWDMLEGLWYTHVIDFDERKRRAFIETFTSRAEVAAESAASWLQASWTDGRGPARSAGWIGLLLGLAGVSGGTVWFVRLRRADPQRRVVQWGVRLRKALGLDGQVTLRRALRAADLPQDRRREAERAVALYEACRFAPPEGRPPLEALQAAVRELER